MKSLGSHSQESWEEIIIFYKMGKVVKYTRLKKQKKMREINMVWTVNKNRFEVLLQNFHKN